MSRLKLIVLIIVLTFTLAGCDLITSFTQPSLPNRPYNLTLESNVDNVDEIIVSRSGPYASGEQVTLVAPEVEGYAFSHWLRQDGVRFDVMTITLTMTQNMTLSANYEPNAPTLDDLKLEADTLYEGPLYGSDPTLRLSANQPNVNVTLSHETFTLDQTIEIEAPIIEGHRFVYWLDLDFNRIVSYERQINLRMSRNQRLLAVYDREDVRRIHLENNANVTGLTDALRLPVDSVVTLEAPAIDEGHFLYWKDIKRAEILSQEATIDLSLEEDLFLGAVYALYDTPQTTVHRFDGASKTSYDEGPLLIGDMLWLFEDALIGTLANDQALNERSVRIRQGALKTQTPLEGLVSVSFYAGRYLTDTASLLKIYLVNEQDTYLLGEVLVDDLMEYQFRLDQMNLPSSMMRGPYEIHFVSESSQRVNLDQISFVTRNIIEPELPSFITDLSGFPNNSSRLELRFDDIVTAFSYGDDVSHMACEAYDITTALTTPCEVHGTVNTNVLGEYDVTYYAVDDDGFTASQTFTKVVLRDASLLEFTYSSYYEGIEGLYGLELKQALRTILLNTVVHQSYGDAREILAEADALLNDPSQVLLVYDRQEVPALWDGLTWHREHVWPNSRLGVPRATNTTRNIATDLHNLRAIDPSVNSSRSNKFFDLEDGPMTHYPGEDKGDVARIYFYMITMYAHLQLRDAFAEGETYTEEGAIQGVLSTLIMFHFLDPVDAFEHQRNNVIFTYQQNRNPFIDYPHLVELIWFNHPSIPTP